MNPRRRGSLAGTPLLIGALTTLIVVVAVFLSYNANNGLPFVPTYDIKVELPETSGLQKANQVRIAGTRVGIVSELTPRQNPATGRFTAIAALKLEKGVQPLPADTKAIVQSVSAIGLKYLELEKGTSRQTIKPGGTIPLAQVREPVDIISLFNMFDQKTRTAIQNNTINFGDGLAARGIGLSLASIAQQIVAAGREQRQAILAAVVCLSRPADPQLPRAGFIAVCQQLDRDMGNGIAIGVDHLARDSAAGQQ